jgi:hypothetical protein
MAYSSTMKIEEACSSETSDDLKRTMRSYIPEGTTLHNHRCKHLKSWIVILFFPFKDTNSEVVPNDLLLCEIRPATPASFGSVMRSRSFTPLSSSPNSIERSNEGEWNGRVCSTHGRVLLGKHEGKTSWRKWQDNILLAKVGWGKGKALGSGYCYECWEDKLSQDSSK